jgi:prepilin-type N-terminal cleavage/methylation domain-containing protein
MPCSAGFSLFEMFIVLALVAILLSGTQASFVYVNDRFRAKADRCFIEQLLRNSGLESLLSGIEQEVRLFDGGRGLRVYARGRVQLQWRLSRADCHLCWRGLSASLRFRPQFLSNAVAGRLSYRCQRHHGEFALCLSRFGQVQACRGTNDAGSSVRG